MTSRRVVLLILGIAAICNALTVPPHERRWSQSSESKINDNPRAELVAVVEKEDEENPQTFSQERQSRRLFLGSMILTGAIALAEPDDTFAFETIEAETRNTKDDALSNVASTSITTSESSTASKPVDWENIFRKASKKALGGGKAGAAAAVVQVCSLMWLRTSMNYQYRYGGNLQSSLTTLWEEGGIARLYQGLPFALLQGPLTRFGDTAANVGVLALLESLDATRDLPLPIKTACGSISAGLWRIVLMPIDASKTAMQVEGKEGLEQLWSRVADEGPSPLYKGAIAQAAATAAGHFPWFATYNFCDQQLPAVSASDDLLLSLGRSALLGLSASCVSDCVSNSLRVIKTTKQTAQLGNASTGQVEDLSYPQIVQMIIETDGILGLLGRGLQTRLLTNAIQGMAFSVLWKYFQQVGSMQ